MAVAEHPTTWLEDVTEKVGKVEPIVLECVLDEMDGLASKQDKRGHIARVATELAQSFSRFPSGKANPDAEIMSAAITLGAAVATADMVLAANLRDRRVRVFSLRSGRLTEL